MVKTLFKRFVRKNCSKSNRIWNGKSKKEKSGKVMMIC